MISSGRISWALAVGTNVLIWVYLVFLLLTLTMLLLNTLHTKVLLVYYYVLWMKRWFITIWIQVQQTDMEENYKKHIACTCQETFRITSIQNIKKQTGRCTNYHKKGRCIICQINTAWMGSIGHVEKPDNENWHRNYKSVREFFSGIMVALIGTKY